MSSDVVLIFIAERAAKNFVSPFFLTMRLCPGSAYRLVKLTVIVLKA
jgi:hypothetical protein